MSHQTMLPRYDRTQTYAWNYANPPEPQELDIPAVPGQWTFCGRPVDSPLGIPAGPLLNGRWVLYYASLGFDVLTYKTVRSVEHACYPLPNLVPVRTSQLSGDERELPEIDEMRGSWAVSFGMPSMPPETWRRDVEWTRAQLPANKLLTVSLVGTVQPGWSIDHLADDYAQCAQWAIESGADCIETNFSCPNVATCDGQLFQQPREAAIVAARVRDVAPSTPFIAKVGHISDAEQAEALLTALAPFIDGFAMTNSVATQVLGREGEQLFDGHKRGICGTATRNASVAQTRLFSQIIQQHNLTTRLIGVGGAESADCVREYLNAGAESIQLATAAMVNPLTAIEIRRDLANTPAA